MKLLDRQLFPAWLLGIIPSYFALGFLSNFYSSIIEIFLLAVLIHAVGTLSIHYVLGRGKAGFQVNPADVWIILALFAVLTVFLLAMHGVAVKFPSLFDPSFYSLETKELIYFGIAIFPSFLFASWALPFAKEKLGQPQLQKFVDDNAGGLTLSLLFFGLYLFLVSIFNQPTFDVDDIFFDSDALLWRRRFATELVRDYYWRSVHPFVLIIIRPLVWLIALLLKGNTLHAAFVLNAFTGALCVFLVWYFVKQLVGRSVYAMLIAALFGASTAQLAFSSLIETYIFLAAVALVFIVLLIKDKPLHMQVITGLVAFGITISNFGQTVIAHFFVKRNIRQLIVYGLIVAALVIPLTLLNNIVYPESQPYFFDLSTYESEGHNQFPPTLQRANLLGRVMFLHSFIAPEPLILQEEIPFLKVWMFRASIKKDPMQISRYETDFSRALVVAWFGFMALGCALFLKNLRKQDNRFFLTFIMILLFNFALHMRYGKDVFLYSVNWTYAIVLFLALAWKEFADKRWFQISLLVFIALMLFNNSQLILTMLRTSALHIK